LSLVLSRALDEDGELAEVIEGRIANIFFIFSQAENHVKEMVAERTVLHSKNYPYQATFAKPYANNLSQEC